MTLPSLKQILRPSAVGGGSHLLVALVRWGAWAVLALVAARGVAFLGEEFLRRHTLALRTEHVLQSVLGSREGASRGAPPGVIAFVERNPFGVPPRPAVASAPVVETPAPGLSLADVQVEGTVAGVGALVSTEEGPRWILQREEFRGYLVFRVQAGGVLLSRDGQETFLPLVFVGGSPGAPASLTVAGSPSSGSSAPPALLPAFQGKVSSAAPGKEGVVAREVVNALLMNPFDELKLVRLIPKVDDQGKAGGLEVAALEDKSILSTLGVRPGDVIKGINGITMNNMGDVANAINSLMGGSKFDVAIVRDGKPEQLSYAVK